MSAMLRVRIRGLEFLGQPPAATALPFEGFAIGPRGFSGWDDGVQVRRDSTARPRGSGDFQSQGFPSSRAPRISGTCVARSPQKLDWFRSAFTALASSEAAFQMNVDHLGETRFAMAEVGGTPLFEVVGGTTTARFQLELYCADPNKYGAAETFGPGTTVTAHHWGNAPAAAELIVTGVAPGYTVHGPDGAVYTVTAPLTLGVPHSIDMETGLLRVGGSIVYGAVTAADTWSVPGGIAVDATITPVSGSASMSITVRSTYL